MTQVTGWQDVTSGERASETFTPKSSKIIVALTDIPNSTPDWNVQQQLPNDDWVNVHADQVDSTTPSRIYDVASNAPTRIYGDTTTDSHYADTKYYWSNRVTATEGLLL